MSKIKKAVGGGVTAALGYIAVKWGIDLPDEVDVALVGLATSGVVYILKNVAKTPYEARTESAVYEGDVAPPQL